MMPVHAIVQLTVHYSFKVRLDRFWAEQEVMYDWTAELARTGDRSEYVEKSD